MFAMCPLAITHVIARLIYHAMFRHIILLETGTLINLLLDAIATPAATDYILSKQYNLEVICDGKKYSRSLTK